MKKEEVVAKILEIAEDVLGYSVKSDEKVFADIDSLDALEIVMNLEREFDIVIEDESELKGLTIDQVADKLITTYEL